MATNSIPPMVYRAPSGGIPPMEEAAPEIAGYDAQGKPIFAREETHTEEPGTSWKEAIGGLFGYGKKEPSRGQQGARNVASAIDMQLGIPAMVVGTGVDVLTRGARSREGQPHEEAAAAANKNYDAIMSQWGSPLHKVLAWAGIGSDSEGDQSQIDKMMGRAEQLIETGGGKAQEATGGIVTTDDVKSLAHAAMALGGAKGMKAGLSKLVAKNPNLALDAVKAAPEMEQARAYAEARNSEDPTAPVKMAEGNAVAAEKAADAKVKIAEGKVLRLDPLTGELHEAIPEMGKELPKPNSTERALEKVSNGRRFDLTAEERIALRGLDNRPLDNPIVDEQGNILDKRAFARTPAGRSFKNSQRGSIELGLPKFITDRVDRSFEAKRQAQLVEEENAQTRQMRRDQVESERAKAYDYLANDAGKFLKENRFLLQKVQALQDLQPVIANRQLAHDAGLSFARLEDVFKSFTAALDDPDSAPRQAQNIRFLLGEMDHKAILTRYLEAVQEARGKLNLRSKYARQMAQGIDEALSNVRRFNPRESGTIDPKLMARLAAVGLGAWAGNYFSDDHDLESSLLGAGGGLAVSAIPFRSALDTAKTLLSEDKRIKINDLADEHEKYTRMEAVEVWAQQKRIEELVPKVEDRNAITHAIEAGDLSKLSPKQQQAAAIAQNYFSAKGGEANLEGILKTARDNYVTHIWDWSKNKGLFERWMERGTGQPGMGTYNRFGDERTIPTIAAGKAAGLTPLTEDISAIMGIYGNSMSRSIANSVFTRALKNEVVPGTTQKLVMATDEAPHSYVSINNPNLAGLRVHPDIAPSLKMLYDTSSPGAAMKIMLGISDTAKRVAVSFSLFHAKALTDAMIGGSSNPFRAVSKIPGFVAGTDRYLKELRQGSASPLVERASEGGLKFSLEGEGAGVEDAGASFYGAMSAVQGALDKIVPHGGAPIKAIEWMNHKVDNLMWARLHAGMKLNLFAEKYQQLLDNAAKRGQQLTPDQAARIAASYTNDLFGGLNWRRVAEDARSRFGRELGQAMLNPGARRVMGLLMFAPDWTISTTRAAVKAFGRPDFLRPTTLAGLHQQYLLRSAAYYLIVGDAINYQMSGHHVWENKDPTVLDMDPKGERHMQWSKHTMEPVHWVTKTRQQAINKLGMLPREAIEQFEGVEYLSAKGRMPPMKDPISHLARNFLPISAQQADQGGAASLVSGFAGVPIYGKTAEQKKKEREERARKKKKK